MKTKRIKKITNKDFYQALTEIQQNMMITQSQVTNLTEIFSMFLEFTEKKDEFMEYLKSKTEKLEEKPSD